MRELFFKPASLRNPRFLDGLVRLRHGGGKEDAEEEDDDEADDDEADDDKADYDKADDDKADDDKADDIDDQTALGERDDGTGQSAVGLQLCA